ncbi:MAG: hypothetical protein KA250_17490, partial [Verrucomicrobiales bacterium]|nr:hypothetical protein [Verrucomicrobiales bacterium]
MSAFLTETAGSILQDPEGPALKLIKRVIGLFLLPVCWLMLESFLVLLQVDTIPGSYWKSPGFLYFGLGSSVFLLLFLLARRGPLTWLYVAGHELTHALFVLVCRGRVTKVHISAEGGHILTNRNNFLISLSPYFFPFYTSLIIIGWGLMEWTIAEVAKPDTVWLYGLIG